MINANQIFTPAEINNLKFQGLSDKDIQEATNEGVKQAEQETSKLQQSYQKSLLSNQTPLGSPSIFAQSPIENLIQWQLELDSILERIEHMLRGDKLKFKGNHKIWEQPKDTTERIMSEFGIAEIMRNLAMYLNRNTILSNYEEDTINDKMLDFGNEITDLIYLKYEVMFATPTFIDCKTKLGYIDNQSLNSEERFKVIKFQKMVLLEKRKLYSMIVRQLVDTVHSAYLRALHGGERQSLHEARQVTQHENVTSGMGGVTVNAGIQRQERGLLNPLRYFAGKYK